MPASPRIRSARNSANTITEMVNAAIQSPFCTDTSVLQIVDAKCRSKTTQSDQIPMAGVAGGSGNSHPTN